MWQGPAPNQEEYDAEADGEGRLATSNYIETGYQAWMEAAEADDIEVTQLPYIFQNAVYCEVSRAYVDSCSRHHLAPPDDRHHPFQIRMRGFDEKVEEQVWITRFKFFITCPYVRMIQCVTDPNIFTRHDYHGNLVCWAITFNDDVMYGGKEVHELRKKFAAYLKIAGMVEVGTIGMQSGLQDIATRNPALGRHMSSVHTPTAQVLTPWKFPTAIHAKHDFRIHEGFHYPFGPYRRHGDESESEEEW
jgi:hypothetical protein